MADRDRYKTVWIAHAVATVLVAAALGSLPAGGSTSAPPGLRLPADAIYDSSVGADSAVVFRHGTHVALAGNRCTGCHPQLFRILAPTRAISHRAMDAGLSCGHCHDGRQAFGVRDRESCGSCHVGRQTVLSAGGGRVSGEPGRARRPVGPKPITYARGESSPGAVTFRHATHVGGTTGCATCHPKPFARKSSGPGPGGGMHEPSACASCHDGQKAFAVADAEACVRCHVEPGGTP